MINFIGKLPYACTVAFSGGSDSVAIADFLIRGKRDLGLAFFHHGTEASEKAYEFVQDYAKMNRLNLRVGKLSRDRDAKLSLEEFWRLERLAFFRTIQNPVVTAHHLDDVVETWIFTSLHGQSRLIPYSNGNVIRPFLPSTKSELLDWCKSHSLSWVEDESNKDIRFMRNRIRHLIVPQALAVNPGLHKVLKKKIMNSAPPV